MSAPEPKATLEGHCSAINDNTLYVLSPDSFQALPLKENATWSSLPTGESVTGPACVMGVPNGDESQAALYVVGGTSSDSNYAGLQRYFFANQTWETLTPPTMDMQGRTNHSAAYLNDTSSILVYAGSTPQSESDLSSQTFVLSATAPWAIEAFTSKAPPANLPILLPWNSSHAVMTGGSETNTEIFTFGPDEGWQQLNTNLSDPLATGVKATLIEGSDGSKVLETFDMSSSPNKVSQIVLLGAGGKTAATGTTVGSSKSSKSKSKLKSQSRKRKRDLTIANWPTYNSTLAPTVTRSDFSVAQDSSGMAVVSGGNDESPVVLFNQQKNAWIDNGLFFEGESNNNQVTLSSSTSTASTSTATSSATSSATASSTVAAASSSGTSSKSHMLRVLGITLGVLFGIAALFIIALLYFRWRKQKRKRDNYVDEKDAGRLSFADRGASFMKEAGGSVANLEMQQPPRKPFVPGSNNSSHNSFAIIAGKFGPNKGGQPRQRESFESTTRLVRNVQSPMELTDIGEKSQDNTYLKPVARDEPHPPAAYDEDEPEGKRKRSSGWSRYFANNDPSLPSAYNQSQHTSASALSNYADSQIPSMPSRIPSSVLVAPLDIDFSRHFDRPISRVASASPAISHSGERGDSYFDVQPQSATVHRQSENTVLSDLLADRDHDDDHDHTRSPSALSSHFGSSEDDYFPNDSSAASEWTPVSTGQAKVVEAPTTAGAPRAPSSQYSASVYPSVYDPRLTRGASSGGGGFWPNYSRDYSREYRPTSRTKPSTPTRGEFAPPVKSTAIEEESVGDRESAMMRESMMRDSVSTMFPQGDGRMQGYYPRRDSAPRGPGHQRAMSTGLQVPGGRGSIMRDSVSTMFPRGDGTMEPGYYQGARQSQGHQRAMSTGLQVPRPTYARGDEERGPQRDSQMSNFTIFPRGVASALYPKNVALTDRSPPQQRTRGENDMSWLNLGLGNRG
ncbi:hypothetical protein M8818_006709 [Zalaria obscura]|uniref:Uncharacterized protein n=1 Tax=Zalaria obscura TaxID=2024903 RepID=A0ACC3S5G2_9PEZI